MHMKSHPKKDQKAIFLSVEQFMVKTQFEISKYLLQFLRPQIFAEEEPAELLNKYWNPGLFNAGGGQAGQSQAFQQVAGKPG